jgi:hypothetical protein
MQERTVIAFSGHLTDAPERSTPRFPERLVPAVRRRIAAFLARQAQPIHGVSSAARGGDLIFIDAVLALGGSVSVVLPFPVADFKPVSVGQGWDERFEAILPRVALREPLLAEIPGDPALRDAAFADCNVSIADLAEELAQLYGDPDPLFLALYKQTASDLAGGTLHAFNHWTARGHRLEIIAPEE